MVERVLKIASEHELDCVMCLVYTVYGDSPVLAPVLVDRGCKRPKAVDLNPGCYLHKRGSEGRQVFNLDKSSVLVSDFPRGTSLKHDDRYRIFFSRSDEYGSKERVNALLRRIAGDGTKEFIGNAVICKEDVRGYVVDMDQQDVKLVDRIVTTEALERGLDQRSL
ncbi:hypothetical protein CC1G_13896 [Coprinopsis cinerea okayama7|uniref:Uncharacterized protein n=1 Tax=Coprinopsis cinerea (strain Okayama-7 / 130 / ATCC MYA-4618 / FGSC 9003) TaxID=240176 RepID=D6RKN0_COPC7|nr:hypothetical protein CC1G_13896 [Coprinopsis cinerea okayama7\|eukprot:XP_002911856.1 hypothetical protein CC1G_13896 [Coprinopsis cinerea okayama7\